MSGKIISLEDVPDQIFSNKIMGDGLAVIPTVGRLYSPITGVIKHINKTGNTILIKNEEFEVLMHIGINSLNVSKEVFEVKVEVGDSVEISQELIIFNIDKLRSEAKSLITPIIFRDLNIGDYVYFENDVDVNAKDINIIQLHSNILKVKK